MIRRSWILFVENLPRFESQIAQLKKGEHVFTPLALDETEAIRKAKPAAGLAEDQVPSKLPQQPAEFLQTIRAAHQASQEILALYEIAQTFTSSLDVRDTLAIVREQARTHHPVRLPASFICTMTNGARSWRVTSPACIRKASATARFSPAKASPAGCWPTIVHLPTPTRRWTFITWEIMAVITRRWRSIRCRKGDRQFGALALYSQTLTSYSEEQLRTLERVASLTSDALHNAMLYAETRANALTDPLTGLPNSRFLHTVFDQEQVRHVGDEHPLTLLTMDLDGFKQINAALGHKLGDRVLKEIGELIREQLRREDMLIRYAGDEFMVLLCNTPMETISEIAVRIQAAVAEHHPVVLEGSGLRLGVSIGQARLGQDGRALEQLLEAAQARLQADKAARRSLNQWAVANSASKAEQELEFR